MKRIILLFLFNIFANVMFCQDNPYKIFGHNLKVNYNTTKKDLLYIKNTDINSEIEAIAIDASNHKVYMLNDKDEVIKIVDIDKEQLLMWLSVDPLADKYPTLSPYAYCANNPVKFIDPDGRYIKGVNGKPVTYTRNDNGAQWSSNASKDVIRVGSAMLKTKTGTELFGAMQNTDYGIDIRIESIHETNLDARGVATYSFSLSSKNKLRADLNKGVTIRLFEDIIKLDRGNIENNIGSAAVHEAVHATNPKNINDVLHNRENKIFNLKRENRDTERMPNAMQQNYKNELFFNGEM